MVAYNSVAQDTEYPRIGLVLSGGGAKGFAHIGVLKVLEEEKIPVDIIVGTSIGSIVGGLYAIGYSAEEIEKMAKLEDWDRLLTDEISREQLSQNTKKEKQRYGASIPVSDEYRPVVPLGVVDGQNIINVFCNLTGNLPKNADFSEFPVSYACIGTDMESGKEVVICNGFLPTAIYSSMTIPGVFLPIEHNGYYMLDGGLVNNFPTDVAKNMGADIIIGVDIRNELYSRDEIQSIEHIMDQLINFYALGKDSLNKSLCDILIRPDISGFNVYSFNSRAVDTLIDRGMISAKMKLDELRMLREMYNLPPPKLENKYTSGNYWRIDKLTLSGNYSMNDNYILDNIDLDIPGICTAEQIKNSVDKLYGLGFFKRVYYNFDLADDKRILNLILDEQPSKNINIGMRINTTDAVSILLNYTQKDYRRFVGLMSFTANFSSNPGFTIQTELSKGKLPVFGLQIDGKYSKFNVFYNQERSISTEIYYGAATCYTYKNVRNRALIGLGLSEEFYKGNIFNALVDSSINLSNSQTAITNIYAYFSADNLDDYYFPTRGAEMYAEFTFLTDENFNRLNSVALFKNRNIIPLPGEHCILLNLYGRAIFTDYMHQFKQNYVGGSDYSIFYKYHLPFQSLPSITPTNNYLFIGHAGLRIKMAQKHYISILGNCLFENNELFPFDRYHGILGAALSYSFNSVLGPLDFTVGYADDYQKLVFSANAGYWF